MQCRRVSSPCGECSGSRARRSRAAIGIGIDKGESSLPARRRVAGRDDEGDAVAWQNWCSVVVCSMGEWGSQGRIYTRPEGGSK